MSKASEVFVRRLNERLRYGSEGKLAELCGVRRETLSRWKRAGRKGKLDDVNPSLSNLEAIAEQLGISLAALISEDVPELPTPDGPDPAAAASTLPASAIPPESELDDDMGRLLDVLQQMAERQEQMKRNQEEMGRDLRQATEALTMMAGRMLERRRPTPPRRVVRETHRAGPR